jgi:hypothetical protein
MEESSYRIESPLFKKHEFQHQLERMQNAASKAQKVIDYTVAHDESIIRAIDIVESFLRKKHRLCYGGQAINAHLPKRHQFYDPEYTIPDYDFFTPNQDEDIRQLSIALHKAGFEEVSAREGMHEGTIKIYVNYIPVADITAIDSRLYKLLSEREYRNNGISYLDANTLRMLMYLELSRPRGEVARWEKVYERLLLLNEYVPVSPRGCKSRVRKYQLHTEEVAAILHYCVQEGRIFAGADLLGFYNASFTGKKRARWLVNSKRPIYMYTPDLERDSSHFKYELRHLRTDDAPVKMHRVSAMGGDLVPNMVVMTRGDYPILVLIEQTACHAYYTVPIKHGTSLRIATLDTLITLYFTLSLLKYRFIDLGALECLAQELIELSYRARNSPDTFPFEFISLECSGNQKRLASLIREKIQRITTAKKERLQKLIRGERVGKEGKEGKRGGGERMMGTEAEATRALRKTRRRR